MNKYFSGAKKDSLLDKFIHLKQSELTIMEYVNQFNELARYGFELINTMEKKALKFAKGLNSPQRKLALNQIPFSATFEGLWLL